MPRSTAKFISYDLRPSKQSERRILIDLLQLGNSCGLNIAEYRYVGMGANRFYDFLLMHKYIGISKMISLEHDQQMFQRALFNVPFGFIDVRQSAVADFIGEDDCLEPTIYWLDYDGGIGKSIVEDIFSFSKKLKVGDFCFTTVSGGPPRAVDRVSDQERLVWLQDNLGDVAGSVTLDDVERSSFPYAVHKILVATFMNSFSQRRDGTFVPLLQVEYTDSMPMVTVGGAFLTGPQVDSYQARIRAALPFLNMPGTRLYEIKSLHLTERERALFDKVATSRKKRSSDRNKLKKLGFKETEISAYRDLVRYFPRYVETIV